MRRRTWLRTLATIVISCGMTGLASAAVITPTAASATTTSAGSATNLRNGTGLLPTGDPVLQQVTDGFRNQFGSELWLAKESTSPTLTFTLPAASTIDGAHIWNLTQNATLAVRDRGVASFDISFSTDGGGTFPTTIAGLTLNRAAAKSHDARQTLAFAQQTGVTHVQFSNLLNFSGSDNNIGLNEVRFDDNVASASTVTRIAPDLTPGVNDGLWKRVGGLATNNGGHSSGAGIAKGAADCW